jgi:phospholipase/lecithinase/hemolysin
MEWIKFSGDPKKFCQWYLFIMAQLPIAPWHSLYDSSTNLVVTTTVNSGLNGKLYAKMIGALEGSALQHMLARKHLKNAIRQFILLLVTNFSHFKTAFAFVLFRTNRKLTTGRPFWFFAEILQFC